MPRLPRIDFTGARHHVMNRGVRYQEMFFDPDLCAVFVDLIGDAISSWNRDESIEMSGVSL
jgi:hypothetical protein